MERLFKYQAFSREGVERTGQIRGVDAAAVARLLIAQGLTPTQINPLDAVEGAVRLRRGRVRKKDLHGLLQELGTLLGSGVSLAEAMPSLAEAYRRHPLGPALEAAHQQVRAGNRLSDALEQPGLDWPAYAMALIRAGEASGELAPAMASAAEQLAQELDSIQAVRTALTYPLVLVTAGVLAILVVFVGVVPRFAMLLRGSRQEIPELSRSVIEFGVFLQANLTGVALGLAGATILCTALLSQPRWRAAALALAARLPLIRSWILGVDLGRWAQTLGALLANRVPYLEAVTLSSGVLRLHKMRSELLANATQLKQGKPLSEVLEQLGWFPDIRLNLVRVGERSGALPRMLQALGKAEGDRAQVIQRRMLTLVEPLAILLIGGAIGFVMVAVMMAITSFNSATGF